MPNLSTPIKQSLSTPIDFEKRYEALKELYIKQVKTSAGLKGTITKLQNEINKLKR